MSPAGRPKHSAMATRQAGAVCRTTTFLGFLIILMTSSTALFSVMASVGQNVEHWPQVTQSVSAIGRPSVVVSGGPLGSLAASRAPMPCRAAQARTQRVQPMHLDMSRTIPWDEVSTTACSAKSRRLATAAGSSPVLSIFPAGLT